MAQQVHCRQRVFIQPASDLRRHALQRVGRQPVGAAMPGQIQRVHVKARLYGARQRAQVAAAAEQAVQQQHRVAVSRATCIQRVAHRPLCLAAVFATMPCTINDRNSACVDFISWPP